MNRGGYHQHKWSEKDRAELRRMIVEDYPEAFDRGTVPELARLFGVTEHTIRGEAQRVRQQIRDQKTATAEKA